MSILGNILWFILGGLILGLIYIIIGLLFCITIIAAPWGYQLMKIGVMAMFPFGHNIEFSKLPMGCLNVGLNIIWIIFGGIELAILHMGLGIVFCVTIIGIPFGLQHFKLAKLALIPFGQQIE